MKTTQIRLKIIATLTYQKLEPQLLSSTVMQLYKTFHSVQNLGRKSKGVRGRGLKTLRKWPTKKVYIFLFSTFITPLEKL